MMKTLALWILAICAWASLAQAEEVATYAVATASFEWHDAARDRAVPAKIYYPEGKTTPSPVILFSHGLGGSRDGYGYLGSYWARHGFVSVHVQHLGSDDRVWKDNPTPGVALRAAAADLRNVANRPRDISFAIDQLTQLAATDPAWAQRLDLQSIGCAGHSFGANTAMLIAGQTIGVQEGVFRDPRVKAVLAMSEPVPAQMPDSVFTTVEVPVFHMTGTRDDSPIGETMAAARRIPFDRINGPRQYLLILKDADHLAFARPKMTEQEKLIEETSTMFWNAYLNNSAPDRQRLDNELREQLGSQGTFETKGN